MTRIELQHRIGTFFEVLTVTAAISVLLTWIVMP